MLEAVPAPLPRDGRGLMEGGRVVVTDDGRGVTVELAARLEAAGIAVDRLGGDERPVDWTSPSAIAAAVDEVRSRGAIAGIVHAMPIGQSPEGDPVREDWSDRIDDAVKGLFLLARATAADLDSAADAGGSCLIAATAMGGRFAAGGVDATPGSFPARAASPGW